MGAACGEYDKDGDLDLYLASDASNRLFMNRGNGEFVDATYGCLIGPDSGRGVAWSDDDRDGDIDL
jgi:hypothetical protein